MIKFVCLNLIMLVCICGFVVGTLADNLSWAQIARRALVGSSSQRRSISGNSQEQQVQNHYRSQNSPRSRDCNNEYNMDYIMMSTQWPAGYCRTSDKSCTSVPNHFTIHGIWPNTRGSAGPYFCCFENRFDRVILQPIMSDLDFYWPSLTSRDSFGFWSHEWLKHGTCSKNVKQLSGELNYFKSSLQLFKRLPIMDTLKKAGITPNANKPYSSTVIQNALREMNGGAKVQVSCSLEAHQPTPILEGFNFCIGQDLVPVDCPPTASRCSRNVLFV